MLSLPYGGEAHGPFSPDISQGLEQALPSIAWWCLVQEAPTQPPVPPSPRIQAGEKPWPLSAKKCIYSKLVNKLIR